MSYEGYYALLKKDPKSDAVIVSFPDHPHINTFGQDRDHAVQMAEDALNETLIYEFERGLLVPEKSRRPRARAGAEAVFVPLRPSVRMAFLLRMWRSEAGLTQKKMARELGVSYQSYQRMERPGRANLTVNTLDKIARVLGKRVILEMH